MNTISEIPEVQALNAPQNLIRIPNQIDVPVTKRVMKLIDTAEFQRLSRVSQLGLVSTVYPAANHSRFEHSLGVYRMTLQVVRQFSANSRFAELVSAKQATALILAGLLHDIGHWPFCHPLEDTGLAFIPEHETLAAEYIRNGELGKTIENEFDTDPDLVIRLIERTKSTPTESLLCSILSGPIDVDKLDYLYRDSLHAGVPYGQNFDSGRLINSLCLNEDATKLALTHKGKTAAELMVFARYVMFSEVYWHHAVRSATAMLQRAFYLLSQDHEAGCRAMFRMDDPQMKSELVRLGVGSVAESLLIGLFAGQRRLFKRLATYSYLENANVYSVLAQQPFESLVEKSLQLGEVLGESIGAKILPHQILIDAPPVALEVQFNVDVFNPKQQSYRSLGDVSPVVNTLAKRQFDDFVKQVRIFVDPELAPALKKVDVDQVLLELFV